MNKTPLLSVRDLKVRFTIRDRNAWPWDKPQQLKAVNGISFDLYEGQTLGIVGESGCGKSSLARAIIGLVPVSAGQVVWLSEDLTQLTQKAIRKKRQSLQMIFQDPLASLDPRMTIGEIIGEPLKTFQPQLNKTEVKAQVKAIMDKVGLLPNLINRYPHEFSGGQCQRIGIARALILKPKLIICDEPVSALDVSIQAQVVNLLKSLQKTMGLSLIFISHDLSIVKHISDQVLVMYLGHAVELASRKALFQQPAHFYTQALLTAIPIPDPGAEQGKRINMLEGDLPSPINPPSGCVFRTRCPNADADCASTKPELTGNTEHRVACLKTAVG